MILCCLWLQLLLLLNTQGNITNWVKCIVPQVLDFSCIFHPQTIKLSTYHPHLTLLVFFPSGAVIHKLNISTLVLSIFIVTSTPNIKIQEAIVRQSNSYSKNTSMWIIIHSQHMPSLTTAFNRKTQQNCKLIK